MEFTDWLKTEQGQTCNDFKSLGNFERSQEFLTTRLHRAWEAAQGRTVIPAAPVPGSLGCLTGGLKVIHMPDMSDGCIGVPTKMYQKLLDIQDRGAKTDDLLGEVNKVSELLRRRKPSACPSCGGGRDPISGDIMHEPDCV